MEIKPISGIKEKSGIFHYLGIFLYKTGGGLEFLFVLFLWLIIFSDKTVLGGLSREEMITYLIVGNIIGLITGYFLERIIASDISGDNSELVLYRPIKFFSQIFLNGLGKNFLPFVMAVLLNLGALYFFIDSFIINFDKAYVALILLMVFLAFITEVLLAYLAKTFIFWIAESEDRYKILMRFKKILAGNYFPLSFLPPFFVSASLMLPFAYSFFVPTQLYLKKITITDGLMGICVQLIWIIILYILIKVVWARKLKKQAIEI